MKQIAEYDKVQGVKCAVWENSPFDQRGLHSGKLIEHQTSDGKKILVCPRCKVDMQNLKEFLNPEQVGDHQFRAHIRDYNTEQKSKKEELDRFREEKRKEMNKKFSHEHMKEIFTKFQMLSIKTGMSLKKTAKEAGVPRGVSERISNPAEWYSLHPRKWKMAERTLDNYAQRIAK